MGREEAMFANEEVNKRVQELIFGEGGPKPFMSDEEIACIKKYLGEDKVMLEWGSGSSTLYYPKFVKEFHSIEHMPNWYQLIRVQLRRYKDIKKKVKLYYVPTDLDIMTKGRDEDKYGSYIKQINEIGVKKYDVILVDGGARDYCCIEALPYLKKDSVLIFHDYYLDKYEHCRRIEDYYKIIDSVASGRTLAVMVKK